MSNKGFTIVEAIIVTAVLAAVTVMAFPNFIQFFQMQEETQEYTAMNEIKLALESYAEENKSLPPILNWHVSLAPYSSYSENALLNDVWGQPRLYKKVTDTITFRSANIDVDYAVVYSHGLIRGLGDSGDPADTFDLDAELADEDDYPTITAVEGDILVKFTNYKQQIKNYQVTEQRLKDIADSLASYATANFNEAIVGGVANAEQFIYYPPSAGFDRAQTAAEITALYAASVVANFALISEGAIDQISVDQAAPVQRKADMEILMRLLGLPNSHCCEALTTGEEAFYYYSNPRARVVNCAVNPRATGGDRKLPPRVRVTPDNCG